MFRELLDTTAAGSTRTEIEFELADVLERKSEFVAAGEIYHRIAVTNPGGAFETRAEQKLSALLPKLNEATRRLLYFAHRRRNCRPGERIV